MLCMDGNSSLKRVAAIGERTASDGRIFEDSDYYLPQSFVDQFAKEVSSAPANRSNIDLPDGADSDSLQNDDVPEGVGDGCQARHWKAAGKKGTWGIFEESGIFASACRHGFILWIVDMIRSGELFVKSLFPLLYAHCN